VELSTLVDLVTQGGPVVVLVLVIWALWQGHLVPRYVYERERDRADRLADQIPQNTETMRAVLNFVVPGERISDHPDHESRLPHA
jgi:hypothetical protein